MNALIVGRGTLAGELASVVSTLDDWTVRSAENPDHAAVEIKRCRPDVVLLDPRVANEPGEMSHLASRLTDRYQVPLVLYLAAPHAATHAIPSNSVLVAPIPGVEEVAKSLRSAQRFLDTPESELSSEPA